MPAAGRASPRPDRRETLVGNFAAAASVGLGEGERTARSLDGDLFSSAAAAAGSSASSSPSGGGSGGGLPPAGSIASGAAQNLWTWSAHHNRVSSDLRVGQMISNQNAMRSLRSAVPPKPPAARR